MKKVLSIAVFTMIAMVANAQKTSVEYHQAQARQVEPLVKTFIHPKVAEMNVSAKRIEFSKFVSNEQVRSMGGDPSELKAYVLAEACKEHNADVIVAAIYFIDSDPSQQGYTVKLMGYPATYSTWRDVQSGDYDWIKNVYGVDLQKDQQSKDAKSITTNR